MIIFISKNFLTRNVFLCSECVENNMQENVRSGYDIYNEELNDQEENVRTLRMLVAIDISEDTRQEKVFYPLQIMNRMSVPVEVLQ